MREFTPWAYCDVRPDGTITYYGVADDHHTQARPNIRAVDAHRWVEEAVAWLGTQGWELVSVVQGEGWTFYFKRPIREQTADVAAASSALEAAAATPLSDPHLEDPPALPVIDPARLIEEEFLPE